MKSSYFTNVLVKMGVKAVKKSKKDTCENFQRLKESDKQSITKQWCTQIKWEVVYGMDAQTRLGQKNQ